MLSTILIAAALVSDGGQAVSVIARSPTPAEARAARTPPAPEGEVRRLCRFERATGSNFQQRVCRDVPVVAVQDQQTREFMRNLQRIRLPDDGAMATSPNG